MIPYFSKIELLEQSRLRTFIRRIDARAEEIKE